MNISSVIVHARSERIHDVHAALKQIGGVEIHAVTDDGKIVATIETATDRDTADTFERIGHTDGVLSAAMVYHQFESDPDEEVCNETDAT